MRRVSSSMVGASIAALSIGIVAVPAHAAGDEDRVTAWEASRTIDDDATIRTGVAKARDPLDSATSTSVIKDNEVDRLGAASLAELFRNVPGIRVEAGGGDINNSFTVRGLPLVGFGSKYISLQEDGLPVLQFGDFTAVTPDVFLRADLNIAQLESIRGGSASTFASNAPGGVINLISKTGEVEGGSVQISGGLDHELNRVDVDYGGHLSDNWRFHVGGFYRQGEGPRDVGYEAVRGGQFKGNVTREFDGGYIRFNVKLLDDKLPNYQHVPVAVSADGSTLSNVPNFDVLRDSLYSRNIGVYDTPLGENDVHEGYRVKSTSLGAEARVTIADWTISERFRYADQSANARLSLPLAIFPAPVFINLFTGGAGGNLTYANGPNRGQAIDPLTVNGNGLIALGVIPQTDASDVGNVANDVRASRVWKIGNGDLTTTAGLYVASQREKFQQYIITPIQDVVGGGNSALVNLSSFGFPITQDGIFLYGGAFGGTSSTSFNMTYSTVAPYGSLNYHIGKLALGGSIRYDRTKASGTVGRSSAATPTPRDLNDDGVISLPESYVALIVPGTEKAIDFTHGYVSFSVSANYRVAEALSLFARYSVGGRAAGEATVLSSTATNAAGELVDESAGHDLVRQLEGGFKFRSNGIFANLTGFYARTRELALQFRTDSNGNALYDAVSRGYRTYGAELEAGIRRGPFSVTGSATLTGGKITKAENPTLVGNEPRHQSTLIYSLTPQFDIDKVTLGANVVGQTSSYAQDVNQLKMPGYTTVGLFAQVRPVDRIALSINASNVFNKRAFVDFVDGTVPALGVAAGRTLYGRLVTASARVFF